MDFVSAENILRACTYFLSPVRFGSSNKMVRASITPQRLQQVANDAAAKEIHKASLMLKTQVDRNVLHCRFLGLTPPNAPLNAKAKGLFEWNVSGMGSTVDG